MDAYGNPKVLWVDVFIPHQQFCPHWDVLERSVVYVAAILKCKQVLFVSVTSALYEAHPAGRFFIRGIEIVQKSSIFIDLK